MYVDFCDTRLCAPLACGVRYAFLGAKDYISEIFISQSPPAYYLNTYPSLKHHKDNVTRDQCARQTLGPQPPLDGRARHKRVVLWSQKEPFAGLKALVEGHFNQQTRMFQAPAATLKNDDWLACAHLRLQ
jgi:hypothetical protein